MKNDITTGKQTYPGSVPMVRINGATIKQLRESKKLTQLYLSTVVGVTTDTISRWENRHYQSIKLENAEKLAQALEVPFEDILKQEDRADQEPEDPGIQPERHELPLDKKRPWFIILSLCALALVSGFLIYSLFLKQPQVALSADRILPPHAAPGQTFPVLIRIHSDKNNPVSLIIKETVPGGVQVLQGMPAITRINSKENALKWIQRLEAEKTVYAYLCKIPSQRKLQEQLVFQGSVTLKKNVSRQKTINGENTLTLAPFHWADGNNDYIIDDEEILAVYDTYSDIEKLPFDRELIDSIWASSGYKWDPDLEQFITFD